MNVFWFKKGERRQMVIFEVNSENFFWNDHGITRMSSLYDLILEGWKKL